MSLDWYPGIRAFCGHWQKAEMLQETFAAFEREFTQSNDACIDAAKGLVECACRVLIETLDDPASPLKPSKQDTAIGELLGITVRLLKLGDIRDRKFADLIKQHNKLADTLRELRNDAGNVSHGKEGFIAKLSAHHQRAAVLAADAIVTFLHEAYLASEVNILRTKEPYERFSKTHSLIDAIASCSLTYEEDRDLYVVIELPTGEIFTVPVCPSKLLFEHDRMAYIEAVRLAEEFRASVRDGFQPIDIASLEPLTRGEVMND